MTIREKLDQAGIDASLYTVLNDGQFKWPASLAAVEQYDGDDILSDEGVATAGAIPEELVHLIGYGVGSQECIDLCNYISGSNLSDEG